MNSTVFFWVVTAWNRSARVDWAMFVSVDGRAWVRRGDTQLGLTNLHGIM